MQWENPGPNTTYCPVCKEHHQNWRYTAHPIMPEDGSDLNASDAEMQRVCPRGHEMEREQ